MWLNCLKALAELCSGVSYCDNEIICIQISGESRIFERGFQFQLDKTSRMICNKTTVI